MNSLQFISHKNDRYGYIEGIRFALQGGCKWIQLRIKYLSDDAVRPLAQEAISLCRDADAIIIIDDRVELAKELGADGVHLGKNDMAVVDARKILGNKTIIGGTANTIDDVRRLYHEGADYIGCGPMRFTATKEKLAPALGIDGYKNIIETMKSEGIDLPLVAIGGLTLDDIHPLISCGVNGLAVSGSILNAVDPAAATANFVAEINNISK